MEQSQLKIYQVIAKLLDGKSRTLNFETQIIPVSSIKAQIENLTSIPIPHQLLISNGKTLSDDEVLYHGNSSPSTVHLLLRLRGGKGGFGSLLRGAATKAGQKKTNNFDACRDMSGRRLRHVNAEKKMEEWLAEEKERKLEKVAEEFIKKKAKAVKKAGGGGGEGAEKYVEKYRKDSAKCMEEVDKSVRESLAGGYLKSKRKVEDGSSSKSKKLKIWMGKRKVDDSDSDDMDEEDSDDETHKENEKSVVTNNDNQSESNKESNGSIASVTGGNKIEGECSVGCSSGSASEGDKETVTEGELGSFNDNLPCHDESILKNFNDSVPLEIDNLTKPAIGDSEGKQRELTNILNDPEVETADFEKPQNDQEVETADFEKPQNDQEVETAKDVIDEEKVSTKCDCPEFEKPLNFDEFNSAAEMEVLGMERLKTELQERGLKCGGTLQERAARLFLLKTTPLEKLPKKLLAKK